MKNATHEHIVQTKHLRKSAFHKEEIESPQQDDLVPEDSIYSLTYPTMKHHGELFELSDFAGRVALVINVASEWGKTEATYSDIKSFLQKYSRDKGDESGEKKSGHQSELVILAFPTNDFHQEPGTNEEIEEKVKELLGEEYENPNFMLFHKSKLEHNPIYKALKVHLPKHEVKHNFYKYIIGRDGVPVAFFSKKQTLFDIEAAIQDELESV